MLVGVKTGLEHGTVTVTVNVFVFSLTTISVVIALTVIVSPGVVGVGYVIVTVVVRSRTEQVFWVHGTVTVVIIVPGEEVTVGYNNEDGAVVIPGLRVVAVVNWPSLVVQVEHSTLSVTNSVQSVQTSLTVSVDFEHVGHSRSS